MLKAMPRIFASAAFDFVPTPVRPVAGFGRTVRCCVDCIIEAMRLLRAAPPLGDVGNRGSDLTDWVETWNRRENPSDFYRE